MTSTLPGLACDNADVLYHDLLVQLPIDLAEGDEVRLRPRIRAS